MIKNFCSIEYINEDGYEIVDHAILSIEEQMKLMDEFIHYGIIASIHEHASNVYSEHEEKFDTNTVGTSDEKGI